MTPSTPRTRPPSAPPDSPSLEPEALWVVDASNVLRAYDGRTNRVVVELDLGRSGECRWWPVSGGGLIWALATDGSVALIDPVMAQVTMLPAPAPEAPPRILGMPHYAHGAMWIWGHDRLWRITRSGYVSSTALSPELAGPGYLTATGRWLFLGSDNRLIRVDPETGAAKREPLPRSALVHALAAGADVMVALCRDADPKHYNRPDLLVLDPDTAELKRTTRVPDRSHLVNLYQVGDEVWALSSGGTAMRIDGDNAGEPFAVKLDNADQDFAAAATGDCLWVVDEIAQLLVRITPSLGRISARLPIPEAYWDDPWFRVVAGRRAVWVICHAGRNFDGIFRVDAEDGRLVQVAPPTPSTAGLAVVAATPRATTAAVAAAPIAEPVSNYRPEPAMRQDERR